MKALATAMGGFLIVSALGIDNSVWLLLILAAIHGVWLLITLPFAALWAVIGTITGARK